MLGQLMPCGGGPAIPLLRPKLLVGRQSYCDVPIRFATVSSRHCELEFKDGYWFVHDLGSSNGTRVNGKPCRSQKLLPNDVLWLAQYRFSVVYTPPAEEPPASPEPAVADMGEPGPSPASEKSAPPPREDVSEELSLGELIPCGGGDPIPLEKPNVVVGRSPQCDIVLRFGVVSSRHCRLDWENGYWFVHDLGSHNGIRVDGVRCTSERLPPGSVLGIATLRYEVVYRSPGAAPHRHPLFARGLLEKAGLTGWRGGPGAGKAEEDGEGPPRPVWRVDDFS